MDRESSGLLTVYRRIMIILCILSAVLLAVTVIRAVAGGCSQEELLIEVAPPAEEAVTAVNLLAADTQTESNVLRHNGEEKNVNIMLIGQDAGKNGTRSDAMILCTFNRRDNTIIMTSFLRDLYVKIPGHRKNRINAAYAFGGTELLNKTLYENFGIKVDGSIQVDFGRFEEIIDLMGGVTLDLTAAEAKFINRQVSGSNLTRGKQLLSGRQALAHVRNRYDTDGDFSRTNRQRQLLNAMISAYKQKTLPQMLSLMRKMAPMVTTDITKRNLTEYAVTLFPMLSGAEIRTQAIPVEGSYSYQKINGKSVLVPDLQKNIQALEDTLS